MTQYSNFPVLHLILFEVTVQLMQPVLCKFTCVIVKIHRQIVKLCETLLFNTGCVGMFAEIIVYSLLHIFIQTLTVTTK